MLPPVPEDWELEEALRRRLAALADAARLPLPSVELVPDRKRRKDRAYVVSDPDEQPQMHVTENLLTASAAEQEWHLAACLGWWASPVPGRRVNEGGVLLTVALLPHLVWGLGHLTGLVELPKPAAVVMGLLVGVVLPVSLAGVARRNQRALEDAGHDVLRAAGRGPAAVARQAFAGAKDPAWYRRPLAVEPTPSQRIALAERHELRPHQPLH
jgi:hypothetical protein